MWTRARSRDVPAYRRRLTAWTLGDIEAEEGEERVGEQPRGGQGDPGLFGLGTLGDDRHREQERQRARAVPLEGIEVVRREAEDQCGSGVRGVRGREATGDDDE